MASGEHRGCGGYASERQRLIVQCLRSWNVKFLILAALRALRKAYSNLSSSIGCPSIVRTSRPRWGLGAVLCRAIGDANGDGLWTETERSKRSWLRVDARKWFGSREKSPGTFEWTFQVLKLDPDATRRAVFRLWL